MNKHEDLQWKYSKGITLDDLYLRAYVNEKYGITANLETPREHGRPSGKGTFWYTKDGENWAQNLSELTNDEYAL